MASTIDFAVITPGEVKFTGKAEIVIAPGAAGDLGAQPQHAPMLTTLRVGLLRATVEGSKRVEYAVRAGFMQILPDKVVVLTDSALAASDVNVESARAELRDAEVHLAAKHGQDDKAEREAVAWANARLEVAHMVTA